MMGYGGGFGGFGMLLLVVFWVALTALVVWAVSSSGTASAERGGNRRGGVVAVVLLALLAFLVSAVWAFSGPRGFGGWMHDGRTGWYGGTTDGGMMGGGAWDGDGFADGFHGLTGTGPVTTLEQAEAAAQRYGDRLGLEVGEVMQFDNGFYAALHDADDAGATEVLVDAEDGDVRVEYGPAMMWNTAYGMHAAGTARPAQVSREEARELAADWLSEREDDEVGVGEAEEFPGYYTLHTELDDEVTGMLSVNAYTGAVWFHSWHGSFIGMTEH